jgi:hypothetical protein
MTVQEKLYFPLHHKNSDNKKNFLILNDFKKGNVTEGLDFFSQRPNFLAGRAGKFSQELATLILFYHFSFRCPKYMHSILTDLYKSHYGIFFHGWAGGTMP